MKGIILAGGEGTRLRNLTVVTSKQLLPIYDQPMVYYPLQTLIRAGIKEVLIIVAPKNAGDYLKLLGSGKDFGAKFTYEIQDKPEGIAQAFLIGDSFIGQDSVTLILGDNLFIDEEETINSGIRTFTKGGRVFVYEVPDPERFGVVEFDKNMKPVNIVEKPKQPKSNFAVTGLYVYDNSVIELAKSLKPSGRGELEITDLNNVYLKNGNLDATIFKGNWIDCGTFDALLKASNLVSQR